MKKLERKRRSEAQKIEAVRACLLRAFNTMSAHNIGRELGYANGVPVYDALEELQRAGEVDCVMREYRGTDRAYWYHVDNEELKVS